MATYTGVFFRGHGVYANYVIWVVGWVDDFLMVWWLVGIPNGKGQFFLGGGNRTAQCNV